MATHGISIGGCHHPGCKTSGCGRALIVLLAVEQGLTVPEIAPIVRKVDTTVLRCLKRYQAEGAEGLKDALA